MSDQRGWKIPGRTVIPGAPGRPLEEPADIEITLDGSKLTFRVKKLAYGYTYEFYTDAALPGVPACITALDRLLTRRFEVRARNRPEVYGTFATRKEAEQFFTYEDFDPDMVVINEMNSREDNTSES
jgi:hypothetical protein